MNIFDGLNLYANSFKYYYGVDRNTTFIRGLLKQSYKFSKVIDIQDLLKIDKTASFMTYFSVVISIVLFLAYFYGVFFKNYLTIMHMQPIAFSLLITVPVMIAILIPYLTANFAFENYLKNFGEYTKEKEPFKIPLDAGEKTIPGLEKIKKRVVKEALCGIIAVFLFLLFALFADATPKKIVNLIKQGKYEKALKTADLSLKILPVSSRNYGYRAAAKYFMKDYKGAVQDYELANKYSGTEFYDADMFLAKGKILSKKEMLLQYDKSIKSQKSDVDKYSAIYSKANYLYGIKDFKDALSCYNLLINAYSKDKSVNVPTSVLYFRRAMTYQKLGNVQNYKIDIGVANSMCPDCEFEKNSKKWLEELPSLDY